MYVLGNDGCAGVQGFPGLCGLKGEKGLPTPGVPGLTGPKGGKKLNQQSLFLINLQTAFISFKLDKKL